MPARTVIHASILLSLLVGLNGCATSPPLLPERVQIEVPEYRPDKTLLLPTPGPQFPEMITPYVLEESQVWWTLQLKKCNADKRAIYIEAYGLAPP